MVRAGETGGVLEEALLRVADQLEKDDSLRRQVKSAMVYPARDHHLRGLRAARARDFLVPVFEKIFKPTSAANCRRSRRSRSSMSHVITGYWYC